MGEHCLLFFRCVCVLSVAGAGKQPLVIKPPFVVNKVVWMFLLSLACCENWSMILGDQFGSQWTLGSSSSPTTSSGWLLSDLPRVARGVGGGLRSHDLLGSGPQSFRWSIGPLGRSGGPTGMSSRDVLGNPMRTSQEVLRDLSRRPGGSFLDLLGGPEGPPGCALGRVVTGGIRAS